LHTTIAGENDYFESVPELYQDDTPPPLEPDTKDEGEVEVEAEAEVQAHSLALSFSLVKGTRT
jgi:hypothetical protein